MRLFIAAAKQPPEHRRQCTNDSIHHRAELWWHVHNPCHKLPQMTHFPIRKMIQKWHKIMQVFSLCAEFLQRPNFFLKRSETQEKFNLDPSSDNDTKIWKEKKMCLAARARRAMRNSLNKATSCMPALEGSNDFDATVWETRKWQCCIWMHLIHLLSLETVVTTAETTISSQAINTIHKSKSVQWSRITRDL